MCTSSFIFREIRSITLYYVTYITPHTRAMLGCWRGVGGGRLSLKLMQGVVGM